MANLIATYRDWYIDQTNAFIKLTDNLYDSSHLAFLYKPVAMIADPLGRDHD